MVDQCISGLNIRPEGTYVDGTVGGGGHSSEIIKRLEKKGLLVCIDQDREALQFAVERIQNENENKAKILFNQDNFSNIKQVCKNLGVESVDGILLDIGVSSYQIDNPERGFTYRADAPLDMRMNQENGITAYEIVNTWSIDHLKEIFKLYGEERWSGRIAREIVQKRSLKNIETTLELVDIIQKVVPAKTRKEGHPAKRVFQALRIAVNRELEVLEKVIEEGFELLSSGGRFCIITFHSLEDRIVKKKFALKVHPCECPREFPVCMCKKQSTARWITKNPIVATEEEIKMNSRSKSAKLRILEKR